MDSLSPVAGSNDILSIQSKVREVYVHKSLNNYIVDIIGKTRNHPDVLLGSSTRGSLALFRAAQAWALYNNRNYVIPDDIKKMTIPVLSHRIILKQEAKLKKITQEDVLLGILDKTTVPVVDYNDKK